MVRNIAKHISNEKAFTLIEVIVSLVLAGILAVIVGLGLVQITKGYIFAKQNSETVQKAQIAMTRIVKELGAATSISTTTLPTATSITYTRPVAVTNTLTISGVVQMTGTTIGTIINNVVSNDSSFAYFDTAGNQITTPTATTVPNIKRVDVTLTLTISGADKQTFTNSVWINESY